MSEFFEKSNQQMFGTGILQRLPFSNIVSLI